MSTDVSSPEEQTYWIQCSDGEMILMPSGRLQQILSKMPTLRYLFFGHPKMQAKELTERDGIQVLEIPTDLCVSKESFRYMVNVMFGLAPLPGAKGKDCYDLANSVTALGGSDELEDKIRKYNAPKPPPLTPEADLQGEYDWQLIKLPATSNFADYIFRL